MKIEIDRLIEDIHGKVLIKATNEIITAVCQDSREAKANTAFFAIAGESFDGHDYLDMAVKNGCNCIVVDNENKVPEGIECTIILVEDTTKALQQLAKKAVENRNMKIVGVTGSTGKTSTRDMAYYICSEKFKTGKNRGNYNTVVGVPLTILELDDDTEVAILEMGMDQFGEIDTLVKIANPDIALITNIGISHMEKLGSREGIFKAKMEITNLFNKDSVLVFSKGEDFLRKENIKGAFKVVSTGIDKDNDLIIENIKALADHTEFDVRYGEFLQHFTLPVVGVHNVHNASLAIACGLQLGISLEEAAAGLAKLELTGKRSAISVKRGVQIIDDTYNASPDSMKAALNILENMGKGRKIAVLGDMYELGKDEAAWHREVGDFAKEKADVTIAIGELAKNYGFENYYENKGDFLRDFSSFFREGDIVLFKASRGMAFEEVIGKLFD